MVDELRHDASQHVVRQRQVRQPTETHQVRDAASQTHVGELKALQVGKRTDGGGNLGCVGP